MLKWGILGTSFISETMAVAIANDAGSCVHAVAGRRAEATAAFAQKFSVTHEFTDYRDLIQHPEVDIVYIGLPNHIHHDYIIECVKANKHILSEKSLSIDMEKTQQIVAALANSDLFFMEGLMYLHHPVMHKLVELLQAETLGTIKTVTGQYHADIAAFVNAAGKGVIYNLGCYPVSLLHLVLQTAFGPAIWSDYRISGSGLVSEADGNVCEASLSVALPNGVAASVHSAETFGMMSEFVIVGDKGSLRFESNPWLPDKENALTLTLFDAAPQHIKISADGDAFYYQVKQIREALEQGNAQINRPAPSLKDSAEIMQLLTQWEQDFSSLRSVEMTFLYPNGVLFRSIGIYPMSQQNPLLGNPSQNETT